MTFVVTENCIKCKYMDCVEVCPVDCFHAGPNFLVIDPDEDRRPRRAAPSRARTDSSGALTARHRARPRSAATASHRRS